MGAKESLTFLATVSKILFYMQMQCLVVIIANICLSSRAVLAELVRASYLIDTLSMLKVEGSNPGFANYFLDWQSLGKNELFRDVFAN